MMQFLKKPFDFYIFSNIHVAMAGFCLTEITLINYEIPQHETSFFVALSIIVSYNFIRYYEVKTKQIQWFNDWFSIHKKWVLLVSIFAVLGLLSIFFLKDFNQISIVILIPFGFMVGFYVIPLVKIGNFEFSFRNFPFIKIFSIAGSWAGVSVLFPLYEADYELTTLVYMDFVQRVFLIIAITLPFDIRDLSTDESSLKTLPQVLGINGAKILGIILLIFVIWIEFSKPQTTNNAWVVLACISIITALFLLFTYERCSRYYTGFWVESIPIWWFVLIVLFLN